MGPQAVEQLAFAIDLETEESTHAIEDSRFLTDQLITYIGNKRSLLGPIGGAVQSVQDRLGRKLTTLDAFAGSGVVSRMLKAHSSVLNSNDLEPYSRVMGECYLTDTEDVPWDEVETLVAEFNQIVENSESTHGFIERLYAPKDEHDIQPGERCFYTPDNARRLDHYRQLIGEVDLDLQPFLLAPLLSAASVNANTAGVFKGFYKDKHTGIGRFGGAGEDALSRIKGRIELRPPITSTHNCDTRIFQTDANELAEEIGGVDLAYLDPPYNQHPYGSNYFMLNLLVDYVEPESVSSVSGIPTDWRRSGYNVRAKSAQLMRHLVETIPANFLLISFNDEGYIAPAEMHSMLESVGSVTEYRSTYNTFRGSRNLSGRSTHVTEHLYLVEKGT